MAKEEVAVRKGGLCKVARGPDHKGGLCKKGQEVLRARGPEEVVTAEVVFAKRPTEEVVVNEEIVTNRVIFVERPRGWSLQKDQRRWSLQTSKRP